MEKITVLTSGEKIGMIEKVKQNKGMKKKLKREGERKREKSNIQICYHIGNRFDRNRTI